jgi:uncharacterized membrane protein
MSAEYYIWHKSETKAFAIAVIAAVIVFVLFSVYNDYRGHTSRQLRRQIRAEQIAPEPEHKVATMPRRETK